MPHSLANSRLQISVVWLLGLGAFLAQSDNAHSGPDQTLEEYWFRVELLGEPAGSVHETVVREAGQIREIESKLQLRVSRFGAGVEILGSERFRVGIPPTLDTWLRQEGGESIARTFLFGPDSLRRRTEGRLEPLAPLPPDLILAPAIESWFRGDWAVGETRSRTEFMTDTEMLVPVDVTAEASEVWSFANDSVTGTRFRIEVESLPELTRTEWRDRDGRLYRARTNLLGLEYVRTPGAIESHVDGPALDRTILVPVAFDFRTESRYDRIRYRAKSKPGRPPFRPHSRVEIEIISTTRNECVFDVFSPSLNAHQGKSFAPPPSASTLAPGPWIESEAPQIADAAKKAVGDAQDRWEQAQRLAQFVHDHVRKKSYEVYFESALRTLDSREGDCTEHAVLLAALARAIDIPARVVSGWIGIEGQMGYHLWTEVNVGGNWIGVDGVFARAPVDARYLPLAVSDLSGGTFSELTLAVLRSLGEVEIEVLDVEKTTD